MGRSGRSGGGSSGGGGRSSSSSRSSGGGRSHSSSSGRSSRSSYGSRVNSYSSSRSSSSSSRRSARYGTATWDMEEFGKKMQRDRYGCFRHNGKIYYLDDERLYNVPVVPVNVSIKAVVSILLINIVLPILITLCFICAWAIADNPYSDRVREKVVGEYAEAGVYIDTTGDWDLKETSLITSRDAFKSLTGVAPYVYIVDNIDGDYSPSRKQLQSKADELYQNLFEDEVHMLVLFWDYDGNWKYVVSLGDLAAEYMDEEALDIMDHYMSDEYYDAETDTLFFTKTFRKTHEALNLDDGAKERAEGFKRVGTLSFIGILFNIFGVIVLAINPETRDTTRLFLRMVLVLMIILTLFMVIGNAGEISYAIKSGDVGSMVGWVFVFGMFYHAACIWFYSETINDYRHERRFQMWCESHGGLERSMLGLVPLDGEDDNESNKPKRHELSESLKQHNEKMKQNRVLFEKYLMDVHHLDKQAFSSLSDSDKRTLRMAFIKNKNNTRR